MNQIFFDIGQTLIDEAEFIKFIDENLFVILNGFGAKIDFTNYLTLRNNVIMTNKIGINWIEHLILKISKLILPNGYESVILREMNKKINQIGIQLFFLFEDTIETLEKLSCSYNLGIISNDSPQILEAFHSLGLQKYFNKSILSNHNHDKRINDFEVGLMTANVVPKNCFMVGDRLDMDIIPANMVGMKTIRFTGSIFRYQESKTAYGKPDYNIGKLKEILKIL